MRIVGRRAVVLVMAAVLMSPVTAPPASAAGRVGPPWVVAASPTSMTLDWSGGSRTYRVYTARQSGGPRSWVKASTSRRKVTGLRPGTMYCFQVARADGSRRSETYCHSTMKRANPSTATPIGVATFNVCAHARGCGPWVGREEAIVQRVLASRADVIALQEVSGKVQRLADLLAPHGFVLPRSETRRRDNVIFYRSSKLSVSTYPEPTCRIEPDRTLEEEIRPHWDKTQVYREHLREWTWDGAVWIGRWVGCEGQVRANAGVIAGTRGASGVWADLRVNATGMRYTFTSVHLVNGRSQRASRARKEQMRRVMEWMETKVRMNVPIVYAGDFNSSRMRADDSPRKVLARTGYVDAFERSSTYSKAYVNSFNGYEARPRRDVRYGDHIDRIFIRGSMGASDWAVVAPLRRGRNVRPYASDHYAVRVTLWLP